MKSPFPGMDPYLEQHWRDVHAGLVAYARDQIQPQLGGALRARIDERVVVDLPSPAEMRSLYPDIRITARPKSERAVAPAAAGVALAEPLFIRRLTQEKHTEGFVEITDRTDGKVITVIEVMSPTNKRFGADREKYQQKQDELYCGGVGLVEIDLLRGGKSVFQFADQEIPGGKRGTYGVCVYRGYDGQMWEYYPISLRDRLPAIRIPLRKTDLDIALDLQKLIDLVYTNGAYEDTDYAREPVPPLDGEDAEWANELLTAAGKR